MDRMRSCPDARWSRSMPARQALDKVSAAAPAMLFSEIEVQKMAQGHDRPPVLPPPGFDDMKSAKSEAR